MAGDSISNFLDVTEAHRLAVPSSSPADQDLSHRAQVLAKLSEGVTSVDRLVQETTLSEDAAKSAIHWLSDKGLVDIRSDPADEAVWIELPSTVKDALD